MTDMRTVNTIVLVEKICLVLGSCLLVVFFVAKLHAFQGHTAALDEAERAVVAASNSITPEQNTMPVDDSPLATQIKNQNLTQEKEYWSTHRKERYRNEQVSSDLLGILEIPEIDVKVAIFDQATESHLNKGVARVIASSSLSGEGNLSIAGHRDSFFRNLGQLVEGDQMMVNDMQGNTFTYQVVKTWIVKPTDTYVLKETENSSITLITCYPFYFVGSAPDRYILRAERI